MSASLTSRSSAAPAIASRPVRAQLAIAACAALHGTRTIASASVSSAASISVYRAAVTLQLPFQPPVEPMLAKLSNELPEGDGWIFEPKWDGFRALVFKSGDELYIQSRDLKPLGRYFPELEATLRASLPDRCVLDGEVVIATGEPARLRRAAAAHPSRRSRA